MDSAIELNEKQNSEPVDNQPKRSIVANDRTDDLESPPDSPGTRLRVVVKGETLKCYYADCEKDALYPCVAIGCCKNYGCG